jgi:hypothetical protein
MYSTTKNDEPLATDGVRISRHGERISNVRVEDERTCNALAAEHSTGTCTATEGGKRVSLEGDSHMLKNTDGRYVRASSDNPRMPVFRFDT